ncbi:MAG: efflux transporter periplasmic adaptor subunit, partial [Caulobacteraceae bacterium]|nr:efflux transporter periplasmic adaptor subunit [Caulobacteraceae bacterium]
ALGLTACGAKAPPAKPPAEVGYVVIRSQAVPLQTELPGRTAPFAISQVRPQVNGIIQARLFQEGANVRVGQPLYRIDPAPYRAAVEQARGVLASAQANLVTMKLKADRYAELVKSDSVARQAYDDAVAAAGQAAASVQQAKAALQTAQINLGYTDIKAPIPGRSGRSAYTQGALVTSAQVDPLTVIQTLDPIYVDLSQSSTELLRLERDIARGQVQKGGPLSAKVRLILEDGAAYPLEGKLQFTDVTVDPASGSVTLRALFPNPRGLLLPGMYVRAQVVEAVDPDGILVPQQAVTRDPKGGATVFVVNAQGRAELRPLQVDQTAVGANWLVLKGLAPGDRVITEGVQKIQPGAAVKAVPAGSAPTPAPARR